MKKLNWLKGWRSDALFIRLAKNAGILFTGNAIAIAFGLIALSFTARALGPAPFGMFAMVIAYVTIIDQLVNFQSSHALIKFGAEFLEQEKTEDFKALVKFCFLLDLSTAILGTFLSALLASLAGRFVGWSPEGVRMASLYSIVIFFNLQGAPNAILRLFDRFKPLALQSIVTSGIKLVGCTAGFVLGLGLFEFLLVWAFSNILGSILLLGMGWRELKQKGITGIFSKKAGEISIRWREVWQFVWVTNIYASFRIFTGGMDTLIIGAFLGASATGQYKIAKQFSSIPLKFSEPLYNAIYPELSKLYARQKWKAFWGLMLKSSLSVGSIALLILLLFAFAGENILILSVGHEYLDALPVLLWCMLGSVIAVFAFPLQPAMLAMGKPFLSFLVILLSTGCYLFSLWFFIKRAHAGLSGAGMALVIFFGVWTLCMVILEIQLLKKRIAKS